MDFPGKRGFSLIELLAMILAVAITLSVTLPVLSYARFSSGTDVSLSNLMSIGFAHALYAADHEGRQVTLVVDDLASYGTSSAEALHFYNAEHREDHPNIVAGWGPDDQGEGAFRYVYTLEGSSPLHHWATMPIYWYGSSSSAIYAFGNFRFRNAQPLHAYVDGRFYGETFYAPNDTVAFDCVEHAFDSPHSFLPSQLLPCADPHAWSSYSFSPAALFHPDVLSLSKHYVYYTDPWFFDEGMNTPGFYQARYPDLKTQVLEHHWNQNPPPDPCNPGFDGTYEGCEPYYFNQGIASTPATLFYDLSVRLLPNTEAIAADDKLKSQGHEGTWSRDTPFGNDGYFSEYSYDLLFLNHHVLTIDGILGRDTLGGLSAGPQPPRASAAARAKDGPHPHAPGSTGDTRFVPEID